MIIIWGFVKSRKQMSKRHLFLHQTELRKIGMNRVAGFGNYCTGFTYTKKIICCLSKIQI